jgi:voltage-gated potassium channel
MTDEHAAAKQAAAGESPDEIPPFTLRGALRDLYFGADRRAARFQYGLIVFDVLTILFFLTVTFMADAPWLLTVDLALALVLGLDFAARIYIAQHPARQLLNWITIADAIVILSLIAPLFTGDYGTLAFLRVLRAARLARSYHLFETLKRRHKWVRQHEDAIQSGIHMVLFLFVTTAVVYVHQAGRNPMITTYVDALYFTVASLTTTGFGDITLVGETGKLLSVAVMIVGIALFIRLAQTIFMPARVRYRCPECGLFKHETDAVHCKHCGTILDIPNEG